MSTVMTSLDNTNVEHYRLVKFHCRFLWLWGPPNKQKTTSSSSVKAILFISITGLIELDSEEAYRELRMEG